MKHKSRIIKIRNKRFLSLILLLLFSLNIDAANFYVGKEIPIFSLSEQQLLNDFGISFRKLTKVSHIKKHNTEVKKLIKKYGYNWKDSLINSTTLFKEDKRIFIKNLFGNKGVNSLGKIIHIRETSCFISYHNNGLIAVYEKKIMLRNNGGSMYHYRIKTKNWNEKGIRINGTNSVFFGSA